MSLLSAAKHEIKHLGLVTLYFLVCFGIVLTLKKLFLAAYQIDFYGLSAVVIGALVVAKVVVILDSTRAGTRLDADYPLVLAASYKTLCYSVATFLVLVGEKVFHAYRESGALGVAIVEVWRGRNFNVILAKVICIGVAFALYHLYGGIDRRLGQGTLWRAIWSRGVVDSRASRTRQDHAFKEHA
jgi:hypothetical protein